MDPTTDPGPGDPVPAPVPFYCTRRWMLVAGAAVTLLNVVTSILTTWLVQNGG